MLVPVSLTDNLGKATATANTAITVLVAPRRGLKTRVVTVEYTVGATSHTLTALRPLARTTVLADAAAAQAVVVLTLDPGTLLSTSRPLAANDFVVFEGVPIAGYWNYVLGQVSSVAPGTVAGSLNVTLTASLATGQGGIKKGSLCWMLGYISSDGHPTFRLVTGGTQPVVLQDTAIGLVGARSLYEPLLLYSNNATNAGTLEAVTVAYTQEQPQTGTGGLRLVGPQGLLGTAPPQHKKTKVKNKAG